MAYTNQEEYLKFLKKKCLDEGEGCNDCGDDAKCTCCPVGLVAVYDDKGTHIGCLTPNDAELYNKNNFRCQDGYVVLIQGAILSCVSESEFKEIYPLINP